jgi:hypothetical protein
MAISYEIDGDFAIVTCEGEFTMDSIGEIVDWVNSEQALPERFKLLILDRSTDFDPSTIELERIAALYGSIKDRIYSRWALVVAKEYHFGLGRMYSVFAERFGLDARVFADEESARAWLDQTPSDG